MPADDPNDLGEPDISVGEMLDEVARGGVWRDDDGERNRPSFDATARATISPSSPRTSPTGQAGPFIRPELVAGIARLTRILRSRRVTIIALLLFGVLVLCCCCGLTRAIPGLGLASDTSEPAQTETVTVTVTQTATVTKTITESLPQSCLDAISQAESLLQLASSIASSQPKVLDIIGRAYSAAVLGDTARLNAAAEDARKLDLQFSGESNPLLAGYQPVMAGLETCK